jgi:hypothetical protein
VGSSNSNPITPSTVFNAGVTPAMYQNSTIRSLYNGNIAAMRTAIHTPRDNNPTVKSQNPVQQLMAYQYDQLNRLTQTRNLELLSGSFNLTDNYQENYSYDPNGNILRLDRTNGQGKQFDKLHYGYDISVNNQLRQVEDNADSDVVPNDLDKFEHYAYDEIGNLIYLQTDRENSTMTWNIYGKLSKVVKEQGNIITTITYTYDATGNRVHKEVTKKDNSSWGGFNSTQRTVYFRDAQGNVLQTHSYNSTYDISTGLVQKQSKEYVIYGSSRLGTYSPEYKPQLLTRFEGINPNSLTLGYKHYELSNHLGNVLTTISDNYSIQLRTGITLARVLSTQDYYPFGMAMTERGFVESAGKKYRFGFNTQERDEDINSEHYTAEFWEYDSRSGRRWNVDPKTGKYPALSGYSVLFNSPILRNDPFGDEPPIGFKEHKGLNNSKLLLHESAKTKTNTSGEVVSFTVANIEFNASEDGYIGMVGTKSLVYQNPDITMTEGSISESPIKGMSANFSVTGINADGLQAIQTIENTAMNRSTQEGNKEAEIVNEHADDKIIGDDGHIKRQIELGTMAGLKIQGEVDGGKYSHFYYKSKKKAVHNSMPYYNQQGQLFPFCF